MRRENILLELKKNNAGLGITNPTKLADKFHKVLSGCSEKMVE